MIPAFVVLLVVALALGGYIAYDVLYAKKKAAIAIYQADIPPITDEEAAPKVQPEITETDEGSDDEITQIKSVVENGKTRYIVIKYSKSFLAKLIQSDDKTKWYYSRLKNRLLSYEGVKSRTSWKWESFRAGRKTLAKLRMRGKTLSLCLALNADDYTETKYHVESLAGIKAYADTPCMYRIKNGRRLRYAEELIAALMEQNGLTEKPIEQIGYAENYPYETTEALIERNLIKELTDEDAQSGTTFKPSEVREKVAANEVDKLMKDEVAASLIEKSDKAADKTKQAIINIDTLSAYFDSGEKVTLDEIKKRAKGFNQKTTYVKVLARGVLDKPLTVEADAFSLQAVKMIVLTGGKAIKKR